MKTSNSQTSLFTAIDENGFGFVPTPTKSDSWLYNLPPRSDAKKSHSRALPQFLKSEMGIMYCSSIAEILMGFPPNWIPLDVLETQQTQE